MALVCLIGSALGAALLPSLAGGQTLKDAVASALATHPQIASVDAIARAARQDLGQARGAYFPSIGVNMSGGKETTESPQIRALGSSSVTLTRREAGVTLSQMLFDGFATRSEVERQGARVSSADARGADTREDVALQAVNAYLEMLRNRELVKLAEANLAYHQQTLGKVQQRVRGGVSQRVDVQQVEARLALAQSTLVARVGRLREVETIYRRVIGSAPQDLRPVEPEAPTMLRGGAIDQSLLTQAIRTSTEVAWSRNPVLAAAEAEVNAAAAAKRGASAAYWPRLDLELSANRNRNLSGFEGEFNNETAMVVMRWNLFRGGSDRAQEQAFAERHSAARESATDTRRQVEERVAVALHAKATSEERLAYLQNYVRASRETAEAYQAQLDLGRRSLLDLLNAVNELFNAESNLAAGRYDDILNRYAVEAAKGTLAAGI